MKTRDWLIILIVASGAWFTLRLAGVLGPTQVPGLLAFGVIVGLVSLGLSAATTEEGDDD